MIRKALGFGPGAVVLLAALAITASMGSSAARAPAQTAVLDGIMAGDGLETPPAVRAYLGKKRILIATAQRPGDPRLDQERREARSAMALNGPNDDLDLVFFALVSRPDREPARAGGANGRTSHIRNRFHVLLVGKDGGIKLSSAKLVTAQTLTAVIEAMPMRREEKARRGG